VWALAITPVIGFAQTFAATCIELNNCVFTNPFDMASMSYEMLVGEWIYMLVWGAMVGTIYVFSKNGMLAGVVGLMISSIFISSATFQYSSLSQAWYMGYILLAVSGGLTLFYLIWTKARNP
jgi:hypothetical protein